MSGDRHRVRIHLEPDQAPHTRGHGQARDLASDCGYTLFCNEFYTLAHSNPQALS